MTPMLGPLRHDPIAGLGRFRPGASSQLRSVPAQTCAIGCHSGLETRRVAERTPRKRSPTRRCGMRTPSLPLPAISKLPTGEEKPAHLGQAAHHIAIVHSTSHEPLLGEVARSQSADEPFAGETPKQSSRPYWPYEPTGTKQRPQARSRSIQLAE